jgi:hypothetical protein
MAWQKLRIPPVGSVCGKRRFHSETAAEMARRAMVDRDRAQRGTSAACAIGVYWCSRCDALHLGRK